ncbi:AAA family ATPase [Acidianus manzaensis]|uniref:AAA+ ATPase domain-containing protein n=1 Tax=Acidianus manzaensis TaxID=282676 RepID=A0A1W6K357_9CREN|nr:AAA family ATPase [Acidianus manzaensis]ARM76915.1 hypothetical protein B6F84_13400 [Acidianus manzaensis]
MSCSFPDYTVAKYNERSKISGRLWSETVKIVEEYISTKKNIVVTIIGEPGMGKTTILNTVMQNLKEKHFIIFLDLVNSSNLSNPAWEFIENTTIYEKIRSAAFDFLSQHKTEIGYSGFSKIREFPNWLNHLCNKRKWTEKYEYAEKLYCMSYEEDINGLVNFLNDLSQIDGVSLLLDEMRAIDTQLSELHKIINETDIPIVITLVPEVYSEIKDSALKRRLDEKRVELKLSNEDKLEILKAYCEDFADTLLQIKEIQETNRLSSLLDIARDSYKRAFEECKNEYNQKDCIRKNLAKAFLIDDIDKASKELENKIREGLIALQKIYGIKYVHPRGRKIEQRGMNIDIFFQKDNIEYLGDVKLTNESTLSDTNIKNIKKLIGFNKDGGYDVRKFIITNSNNVNLDEFVKIIVDNPTIKRILDGSTDERDNLVKRILNELGIS